MAARVQISAEVSQETKDVLDGHVRMTGQTKTAVIERALAFFFQATKELPADIIVPARVVVSRRTGERIAERLVSTEKPAPALVALMKR